MDRSFKVLIPALLTALLLAKPGCCQEIGDKPRFDVFRIMEMVAETSDRPLWPDFNPDEIPVLVFDSINTWLLNSASVPDGFTEAKEHQGVFVYVGQHPLVRGNSIVRMGDNWMATSVLSSHAQRTGEKYADKDLAGIIIHEQFHIFQRMQHPQWRQNDGVLLLYPEETPETLFLRRTEKEAFKRAVTSGERDETGGWAQAGLKYREERLSKVACIFGTYEKELQRTEGLSDYIEKTARELDPLNTSNITNGIAPSGVRDLGYVEGRWIAMILDKLNPGWKMLLEENDSLYLEDILNDVIIEKHYDSLIFTRSEIDRIRNEANQDFLLWQMKKRQEVEQYNQLPGFRIEIIPTANPLAIRIFEPLEIEILGDGRVFHRLIFSAGNGAGSLRIMNHPCITRFDNSLRIEKIEVNGLDAPPIINEVAKKIVLKDSNISIDLKYEHLTIIDSLFVVEI